MFLLSPIRCKYTLQEKIKYIKYAYEREPMTLFAASFPEK